MINIEQMAIILDALPDPAFILSRSGKYVAIFGGQDKRYYHDGSKLVGLYIADLIKPEKANWFLAQIEKAIVSQKLEIAEYELSNRDVKGLPDEGPAVPIWFEGRIQALSFEIDNEAVVLWVASNISERHQLEIKLRELSDTDQLTGLFNRRKLEQELKQHFDTYTRYATPTSLLMFDLDNLKSVNDNLGHAAGDEVIKTVANICLTVIRKNDCICRFGGDEFIIALPNTQLPDTLQLAQRLQVLVRTALSQYTIGDTQVTVSIGATTISNEDHSYEEMIKRADFALYQAKNEGKDRIIVI